MSFCGCIPLSDALNGVNLEIWKMIRVREPLHRIASSLAEFNLPHYFPFQLMTRRSGSVPTARMYRERVVPLKVRFCCFVFYEQYTM